MHNLAVLMSEGVDGQPDYGKALQWFLAAGELRGQGQPVQSRRDLCPRPRRHARPGRKSYKWFAVAAAQGDGDAAGRRDEVAGMLKPDQLAKARAAVQAWRAKAAASRGQRGQPRRPAAGTKARDGRGHRGRPAGRWSRRFRRSSPTSGYDPGPADGVDGPKTRRGGARLPAYARHRRHRRDRPDAWSPRSPRPTELRRRGALDNGGAACVDRRAHARRFIGSAAHVRGAALRPCRMPPC